jgi:hypothetical protein
LRIGSFYKAGLSILSILSLAERRPDAQMPRADGAAKPEPKRKKEQMKDAMLSARGAGNDKLALVSRAIALVLAVSMASLSVGATLA